jgi:DNA-directed RNA polymerase subunit beta
MDVPDLLNIQNETFEEFIQLDKLPEDRENKGLQKVFIDNLYSIIKELPLDFINAMLKKQILC